MFFVVASEFFSNIQTGFIIIQFLEQFRAVDSSKELFRSIFFIRHDVTVVIQKYSPIWQLEQYIRKIFGNLIIYIKNRNEEQMIGAWIFRNIYTINLEGIIMYEWGV